jgi:hypothetical protein
MIKYHKVSKEHMPNLVEFPFDFGTFGAFGTFGTRDTARRSTQWILALQKLRHFQRMVG